MSRLTTTVTIGNFWTVRPSGEIRFIYGQAKLTQDAEGNSEKIVGTVQDITERKQIEDQLRQAQKMETVGQLTAGIAHDFNNILGAALGNIEFIKDEPNNPKTVNRIDAAKRAVLRGADLTNTCWPSPANSTLTPTVSILGNRLIV